MLITPSPRLARPLFSPPVKTHGGKFYLATAHIQAILSRGIAPITMIDGFGGGGTFALNFASPVTAYNDLDPRKFNLFWVLRDRYDQFFNQLYNTPYGLETWMAAKERDEQWSPRPGEIGSPNVDHAVDFVVRSRMSRSGLGDTFGRSGRLRGGNPEYLNAWLTLRDQMPRVASRVKNWTLFNRPAMDFLNAEDDTFIYLDPPYHPDTRSVKDVYDYEMSVEQHEDLIRAVKTAKCPVAICGYHCELYDRELATWSLFEWHVKNNSGQGRVKQPRIECLWINR